MDSFEKETTKRQTQAISELARQVRHDYKSPLMAIKSVMDKAVGLTHFEKKTLSVSYNRMMSMLNDLSHENIKEVLNLKSKDRKLKALTHVYSSVLSVVQEKGTRLGEQDNIKIKISCSDEDKRAYILIDDMELQRVLSNIIENSLEAIQGSGEVSIAMKVNDSNLEIKITDNGKGIPEEILNRIGQKGYSFGKKNGEGLGLYSSIQKVEHWGGTLRIQSNEDEGATVTILLPRAVKPEWSRSGIGLDGIENIVILDDDKSIHQIWDKKLNGKTAANIHKFTEAKQLLKKLDHFNEKTLFLLDYELRGQEETGLDVVKRVGKERTCYIVSNSFQDPRLQRECKKLGVGLFPKTIF